MCQALRSIAPLAIAFESGILLLALLLGQLLDSSPLQQIHLAWKTLAWGVIGTCPPLALLLWCTHSQWGPLVRLVREVKETLVPPFASCSYLDLALISAVAGLGEEALFRGVIQTALANLFNPWVALAVTSTLFGIAHLITPTYAVLAGLIGLYLGWLSIAYGNLLVVIVVHALYDFLALTYMVHSHRKHQEHVPMP